MRPGPKHYEGPRVVAFSGYRIIIKHSKRQWCRFERKVYMLGFVLTAVKEVADKLKPTTLEEELALRGVSTIPLDKVRLFQRAHLQAERLAGNAGIQATWERLSVQNYVEDYARLFGDIPPDVHETIARVKTVPESDVFVERFNEDPFVFIERLKRLGGFTETCCIAYWDAPGFKP